MGMGCKGLFVLKFVYPKLHAFLIQAGRNILLRLYEIFKLAYVGYLKYFSLLIQPEYIAEISSKIVAK